MTNAAKAKVWDAYVTPFGSAKVFTTATANTDLRLPGQWYQAEAAGSGLNQNGYRDYDPTLGRCIEADPLGLTAGQNPYAYVDGKPYDGVDPNGLKFRVLGEWDNYNRVQTAFKYLNKDPGMRKIINTLDKSKCVTTIVLNHNNIDGHLSYGCGGRIDWDPDSYLILCKKPLNYHTPALNLGHELAHGVNPLSWPWNDFPAGKYTNQEEKRVITGPESAAARTLGEPVRTDHGGNPGHIF